MPAERGPSQSSASSTFPFPRRSGSLASSSSSSSSSSASRSPRSSVPSYQPSPSSTLDSEFPVTPPLSTLPAAGQPALSTFARGLANLPGQQTRHTQGPPSHLNPSYELNRSRESLVGYDPGGGGPWGPPRERTDSASSGGFGFGRDSHYTHAQAFSPQDLVIYGPSVPYGFKAPLPLPLPLPLGSSGSRASPALVEPYFNSPVSPAPPFYPNYQGPPPWESPSLPTQDEVEGWGREASGGAPSGSRTLQMSPPVLFRSVTTTDCGRCKSHGVMCEWPGAEGVGACSNCFFSYSLCEPWTPSPRPLAGGPAEPSSTREHTHGDGDRTPTQSPRSLPGPPGSATNRPSSGPVRHSPMSYPPTSSTRDDPSRPSPHIPISFLVTEPSDFQLHSRPTNSPHHLGASPNPSAGGSGSSSRSGSSAGSTKGKAVGQAPSSDSEGEMTEIFGRVVRLQANANANLGQVAETLKSPLPPSPMERTRKLLDDPVNGSEAHLASQGGGAESSPV